MKLSLPIIGLLVAVIFPIASTHAAAKSTDFTVTSIKAFLYYHDTGSFDSEDLVPGTVHLWNTIIAEGPAGGPSSATLILVGVSGPPLIRGSGIWLNVNAVVNDHVLLNKSVALGDFVARKRRVIPFLVYGTGCGDLAISVSISDDELEGEGVKETIHFPCGE